MKFSEVSQYCPVTTQVPRMIPVVGGDHFCEQRLMMIASSMLCRSS